MGLILNPYRFAAPIVAPVSLGVNNYGGGSASYTLTTTAAVAAGDGIFVAFSYDGSTAQSVSSVVDSAGNTYGLFVASVSGTTRTELWFALNALAMGSGNSITVNLSGATTGASPAVHILAAKASGLLMSDQTAHQETTTSTPSVTTAALAIANELVIGVAYCQNAAATYTEAAGYTTVGAVSVNGASRLSYKIVAATTAVTFNPTWSTSNVVRTLVATVKGN